MVAPLFACQCKWLTYKQLGELVEAGVDTLTAIHQRYGVGTECGGCLGALQHYFAAVPEAKSVAPAGNEAPDTQINNDAA